MKVWLTSGILPGGGQEHFWRSLRGGQSIFSPSKRGGRIIFLLIIIIKIICILFNMREIFHSVAIFLRCARYFIYLLILVKFQNFNQHIWITTVLLKLHV